MRGRSPYRAHLEPVFGLAGKPGKGGIHDHELATAFHALDDPVAQGAVGVGDHGIVAPDQNVLGAFPLGIVVAVGEELRVVADVEATSLQGRGEDAGA